MMMPCGSRRRILQSVPFWHRFPLSSASLKYNLTATIKLRRAHFLRRAFFLLVRQSTDFLCTLTVHNNCSCTILLFTWVNVQSMKIGSIRKAELCVMVMLCSMKHLSQMSSSFCLSGYVGGNLFPILSLVFRVANQMWPAKCVCFVGRLKDTHFQSVLGD